MLGLKQMPSYSGVYDQTLGEEKDEKKIKSTLRDNEGLLFLSHFFRVGESLLRVTGHKAILGDHPCKSHNAPAGQQSTRLRVTPGSH